MPTTLPPHKSGAHRIAAIALYRALLTQCKAAPVEAAERAQFLNILRNRYRATRYTASHNHLRVYFGAGYEAIDHLDAAVAGCAASTQHLRSLLNTTPAWMKKAPRVVHPLPPPLPPPPPPTVLPRSPTRPLENRNRRRRLTSNIFDRPLPLSHLTGKRHVPVLFSANWIPVLRLTKPQPASLSAYIASRIRQRQKRNDTKLRLLDEVSIAAAEDNWDELMAQTAATALPYAGPGALRADHFHSQPAHWRETGWLDEAQAALTDVEERTEEERRRNTAVATRMLDVVMREQAALERERGERQAERKRRWEKKTGLQDVEPSPARETRLGVSETRRKKVKEAGGASGRTRMMVEAQQHRRQHLVRSKKRFMIIKAKREWKSSR